MRKMFGLALLVLPLLASSAWAGGADFNTGFDSSLCTPAIPAWKIDFGAKMWLRANSCPPCGPGGGGGGCAPQLGPWYLYWPLEAHFQVPAMPHYPYWPAPQTLPGAGAAYGAPGPGNFHAPVTPVGYAPPYWYGH